MEGVVQHCTSQFRIIKHIITHFTSVQNNLVEYVTSYKYNFVKRSIFDEILKAFPVIKPKVQNEFEDILKTSDDLTAKIDKLFHAIKPVHYLGEKGVEQSNIYMECMKSLSKFKKAVNSIENKELNVYPWSDQIDVKKISSKKLEKRARSQNSSYLNVAYNINKKKKSK